MAFHFAKHSLKLLKRLWLDTVTEHFMTDCDSVVNYFAAALRNINTYIYKAEQTFGESYRKSIDYQVALDLSGLHLPMDKFKCKGGSC